MVLPLAMITFVYLVVVVLSFFPPASELSSLLSLPRVSSLIIALSIRTIAVMIQLLAESISLAMSLLISPLHFMPHPHP